MELAMNNSIISATAELERWYYVINESLYENQLDQNIRIVIQTKGRIKNAIGFFSAKRWKNDGESISEITVCAEDLNKNDPFGIMLHEIVHSFNNQNEIKDCCSNGYHNKHFKQTAELHGLIVEKSKTYGFCHTKLNEDGEKIKSKTNPKMELFKTFRVDGPSQQTYLRKFVCDCGMIIRVARINEFSATCNVCESEFKLAD